MADGASTSIIRVKLEKDYEQHESTLVDYFDLIVGVKIVSSS